MVCKSKWMARRRRRFLLSRLRPGQGFFRHVGATGDISETKSYPFKGKKLQSFRFFGFFLITDRFATFAKHAWHEATRNAGRASSNTIEPWPKQTNFCEHGAPISWERGILFLRPLADATFHKVTVSQIHMCFIEIHKKKSRAGKAVICWQIHLFQQTLFRW